MIQLFYFLLLSKGNEVNACNTCISFPRKQCSSSVNILPPTFSLIKGGLKVRYISISIKK